jgi:hypothetical protein
VGGGVLHARGAGGGGGQPVLGRLGQHAGGQRTAGQAVQGPKVASCGLRQLRPSGGDGTQLVRSSARPGPRRGTHLQPQPPPRARASPPAPRAWARRRRAMPSPRPWAPSTGPRSWRRRLATGFASCDAGSCEAAGGSAAWGKATAAMDCGLRDATAGSMASRKSLEMIIIPIAVSTRDALRPCAPRLAPVLTLQILTNVPCLESSNRTSGLEQRSFHHNRNGPSQQNAARDRRPVPEMGDIAMCGACCCRRCQPQRSAGPGPPGSRVPCPGPEAAGPHGPRCAQPLLW